MSSREGDWWEELGYFKERLRKDPASVNDRTLLYWFEKERALCFGHYPYHGRRPSDSLIRDELEKRPHIRRGRKDRIARIKQANRKGRRDK